MKTILASALVCAAILAGGLYFMGSENRPSLADIEIIEISDDTALFYMTDPSYPTDEGYGDWVNVLSQRVQSAAGGRGSFLIWGGDNLSVDRSFDWSIHRQIRDLGRAMSTASEQSAFVSGNHDYNQIRAWFYRGRAAIHAFNGDQSRIVQTPTLALFLYDAYAYQDGTYDYEIPQVAADQMRAFEAAAEGICKSRTCIAVIGTQFSDHSDLRDHWSAMQQMGLEAIITGDSHESRSRTVELNTGDTLPLLELSPSYGAKLPSELDLSGRPSGLYQFGSDGGAVSISKIYMNGTADHTLTMSGLCSADQTDITGLITIDFLLDGLACDPTPLDGFAQLPSLPITIVEPYEAYAFDVNFNLISTLSVPAADMSRGVILYRSSKADRTFPTHALTIQRQSDAIEIVEYDRWMRERVRQAIEIEEDQSPECALEIADFPPNGIEVSGCGVSRTFDLDHENGFIFGVRHDHQADGGSATMTIGSQITLHANN